MYTCIIFIYKHSCIGNHGNLFVLLLELLAQLEEEKSARQEVEERAVSAEHQCSALKLDLKQKETELSTLSKQLAEVEERHEAESRLRFQAQSNLKREQDRTREKLEAMEQEQQDQVSVCVCVCVCVICSPLLTDVSSQS